MPHVAIGFDFSSIQTIVRVIRIADVRFANQAGLGILAEVGFEFSSDPPPDRPDPFAAREEVRFVKTGVKTGTGRCE